MFGIFHSLNNNTPIKRYFILLICTLIINSYAQLDIKSILNNKANFIFLNFQNKGFFSYTLNYQNTVFLNAFRFFKLLELNNNRNMINNNTLEIKDCLITIECKTVFKLSKSYSRTFSGIIFEYNITKFHLTYNSDNNSFDISNLNISNVKYSLINEKYFKLNNEFFNDINIKNGLFYNFTYNLTYNHLKALCEDFDQLVKDFFNVIDISQKYLKDELKDKILNFYSFNTNHSEYYFTPIEGGLLVNNVSFLLINKSNRLKINCYYNEFLFGKKMYIHTNILNNVSDSFVYMKKYIRQKISPIFDTIFMKSKNEYYDI